MILEIIRLKVDCLSLEYMYNKGSLVSICIPGQRETVEKRKETNNAVIDMSQTTR